MKLDKKNKHKRDKYVRLHPNYDENHVYLIHGKSHLEKGYQSVTTFLHKFFEEFDADAVIDKYYDRWQENKHETYYSLTKDEIKSLWDDKRDTAARDGTHMHLMFEKFQNGEYEVSEYIDEHQNYFTWDIENVLIPYRTEWTVYGAKEKIVGNVDFVYIDNNGDYCICDYKRTSVADNNSFGKKCVGINYPHTTVTKHMLQLNIYKYLIEKYYGLTIKHLYNLYIKENECEFVERQIINVEELLYGMDE